MKLESYIRPEQIVLSPNASPTKQAALEQLVDVLSRAVGYDREAMLQAVVHRESLMSTGIGQGLAVPHVRLERLGAPAVAVGIFPEGISDYISLDKEPVRIVLLIAAPKGQHETYIRLLAAAVDVLKDPEMRQAVLAAQTPADVAALLKEERK
ncbi:MAG: PTS sugar transporter subunit IIA [Phycisphaerae bacterium]|nr:PTS sugar transporter subunit IIA [Phycisphaerae bacterium]